MSDQISFEDIPESELEAGPDIVDAQEIEDEARTVEARKVEFQTKTQQAIATRDPNALPAAVLSINFALSTVLLEHPEKFSDLLERWLKAHDIVYRAAIKRTSPADWVVMKPAGKDANDVVPDTEAIAYPAASGCIKMRAPLGISIIDVQGPFFTSQEIEVEEWSGPQDARRKVTVKKTVVSA